MTTTDAAATTSVPRDDITVSAPSSWDTASWAGLREIVREDRATIGESWAIPAVQMMAFHRFAQWLDDPGRSSLVRRVGNQVHRGLYAYQRNVLGFEIPRTVRIGRRVKFVHQHGVAFHPDTEIGDDCLIRHLTTIGLRWDGDRPEGYHAPPRLGAGVQLGVGSVVIGAVTIGDGANVGPNAVVTRNVPAGASVTAPMSRVMDLR